MTLKTQLRIVVTGGAGFVGSHVVKLLVKNGHDVLVIDNLSTTSGKNLKYGKFITLDLSEEDKVYQLLSSFKPHVVMHFAAFMVVPESVKFPFKYYYNNVRNTLNLLSAMQRAGVKNIIFSSSCTVYGIPDEIPIPEEAPLRLISPYGQSKAIIEKVLSDMANVGEIDYISLRYFNVAGADPEGEIGHDYLNPTLLIIRAIKVALGKLPYIEIYGTDYPTPDGTCIRDYIHVMDIAKAHILAMNYLLDQGKSDIFNCGYGKGYSVKEIIEAVKKITGVNFDVKYRERRPGDPPILIASNQKIKTLLGFKPDFDDLEVIIKHSLEWEKKCNYQINN